MRAITVVCVLLPRVAIVASLAAPVNRRFDNMLQSLSLPNPALACVDGSTQRTLLRGSSAVQQDPLVRRAFQVLYEDMALFRPAGMVLVRSLSSCATAANEVYEHLHQSGVGGALDSALPTLRCLFDAIDADGSGALEPEELSAAMASKGSALSEAAQLCLAADDGCEVTDTPTTFSFADFVKRVGPAAAALPAADSYLQARHEGTGSWDGRFERMLLEFVSWEDEVSSSSWQGRRGEIVAGCFAGARNDELVAALRLVYCENAVLRPAGDQLFRMLRPPSARRA
jgi:hypothetical protein